MKNTSPFTYFKAAKPPDGLLLKLDSMDEFVRYVTFNKSHMIFILSGDNRNFFACLNHGALVVHDTTGYQTLEDYELAVKKRFPGAAEFYSAREAGYSDYEDFRLVKEAGISDVLIFNKMKSQGYIAGYSEFDELRKENKLLPDLLNPYQLYKYAADRLFTDYAHFKSAYVKGFTDAATMQAATDRSYENAADYSRGQQLGFIHGEDYYRAMKVKAIDYNDFMRYMELRRMDREHITHNDEMVLVEALSKLEQGKKVSLNKLTQHLKQKVAEYKYSDTGLMPEWFTVNLKTEADVSRFLSTNETAKKFGVYDAEGEYFETKRLNQRKVVLDGSNVAHNSRGNDKSKATLENIIMVIYALKQRGFTDISVITDASLRHKVTDKENMSRLEAICDYSVAPAETAADAFLISFVKLHRCLLVTNDTFREWKVKDAWVAENIDYYKLSFMIDGDKVIMPDLETLGTPDKIAR